MSLTCDSGGFYGDVVVSLTRLTPSALENASTFFCGDVFRMIVWWEEKFSDVAIFWFEFLLWWPDLVCLHIFAEVRTNGIPTFFKLKNGVTF